MDDRAQLLYQTENVALLYADGRELIHIGRTQLPEEAWWRYGRQLRRGRAAYRSRLSLLGAATYAAVSYVGSNFGLSRITGDFYPSDDLHADIMRWRWFGREAWSARAPCPQCHSVLIRLFFYRTRFLLLLPSTERGPSIALPCSRCDPWTVDKVHRLDGEAAELEAGWRQADDIAGIIEEELA